MLIRTTIKGVTPLLMNAFTDTAAQSLTAGASAVHNGDKGSPREQAARKVYCDDKGQLYIPGPNVFAAIIAAGKFHKLGKTKVTTLKTSLVPAGLAVAELTIPLGTKRFEVIARALGLRLLDEQEWLATELGKTLVEKTQLTRREQELKKQLER